MSQKLRLQHDKKPNILMLGRVVVWSNSADNSMFYSSAEIHQSESESHVQGLYNNWVEF
jgi:hypothetical protein